MYQKFGEILKEYFNESRNIISKIVPAQNSMRYFVRTFLFRISSWNHGFAVVHSSLLYGRFDKSKGLLISLDLKIS